MKETKEHAYTVNGFGRCERLTDGSISHARGLGDGPMVHCQDDRPFCEVLTDGSIAHVPSREEV